MNSPSILFERLPHGKAIDLPHYASQGAAGADVRAALTEPVALVPMQRALIPTGFKMALPEGWEAQIRPRSGLAFNHGVTVLNSPGTIDADYRGEVKILLINLGQEPFIIRHGERIAQMIVAPAPQGDMIETDSLPPTRRGEGGFGSTGKS